MATLHPQAVVARPSSLYNLYQEQFGDTMADTAAASEVSYGNYC